MNPFRFVFLGQESFLHIRIIEIQAIMEHVSLLWFKGPLSSEMKRGAEDCHDLSLIQGTFRRGMRAEPVI